MLLLLLLLPLLLLMLMPLATCCSPQGREYGAVVAVAVVSGTAPTDEKPNPSRLVSRDLSGRRDRPSADISVLLMVFGQFVDHDLTHVPVHDNSGEGIDCCFRGNFVNSFTSVECFPIQVPAGDRIFSIECMNFVRSQGAIRLDCNPGPLQQVCHTRKCGLGARFLES